MVGISSHDLKNHCKYFLLKGDSNYHVHPIVLWYKQIFQVKCAFFRDHTLRSHMILSFLRFLFFREN